MSQGIRDGRVLPPLVFITHPRSNPKIPVGMVGIDIGFIPRVRRRHVQKNGLPKRVEIGDGDVGPLARCRPGLLHLETARRLNHRLESGTGAERPNTVQRVIVRDCAVAWADEEVVAGTIQARAVKQYIT